MAADDAEIYLKNALQQLHLAENFQGEIITRVYLNDKVFDYRTGIIKDGGRADVNKMHTFWQLKGTERGRKIRAIPWFYLPPDFSLVQHALPTKPISTVSEPLQRIEDDYEIKILEKKDSQAIFELDNGYVIQKVTFDLNRNIITQIQVFNASKRIMATIEYVNWKEYYSGVLLPERIKVFGEEGQLMMELVYLNWKVNQGVDRFANILPAKWNEAVEELKAKILEKPDRDEYHYQLAKLYEEQKFWSNALEELDKALALNPKLEYREAMARVYEKLGQYQEAINEMLIVLEKKETGAGYYFLGNLYTHIDNPLLARQAYEQAVELDSENLIYWERLFWNYRNSSLDDERMMKKAIWAGEKLVKLDPERFQYRIYLGDLYLDSGEFDKAFLQYEKARELKPEKSLPLIKLAQYYEKVGQIELAQDILKDAVKVEEHWWNYLQLGDFYLRQAQIEDALASYQLSLQLNPHNTDLAIKLGRVLWQLGREKDAKKYWYQALQYEEANIYTYIKVGEILLEYNLTKEAEEVFMKAIKRFQLFDTRGSESGLSKAYEKIGLMYLEKDPAYAISSFEKSYAYWPGSIAAQYLGLRELKRGNLDLAIKYWSEANLLDGDNIKPYIYLTVVKGLRGEVVGTENQELSSIYKFLSLEERELLSKFFGYFSTVRALRNEAENTHKEADDAFRNGMHDFLRGNLLDAVVEFKRAVEIDKQFKKGHFFLGIVLSLLNRPDEAEKHFKIIQNYYAGSNAARASGELNQIVQKLFWKVKIL